LTQEFADGGTPACVGQVRQLPNSLVEFVIRTDYEYVIIHDKISQGRIRRYFEYLIIVLTPNFALFFIEGQIRGKNFLTNLHTPVRGE